MHNLNCFISGQVSTSIPNLAASLEPVSFICFKKFIIEEYIEFFKNKKRLRSEWVSYTAELERKMDEFLGMMDKYDTNIASLNSILPVIVEM